MRALRAALMSLTAFLCCSCLAAGAADAQAGVRLNDGTYPISVTSSSSMFRVVDARLTVKDGEMSAVLTLGGKGYEKLYMGTGAEALAASESDCIYYIESAQGKYTYEIPVAALDQALDCAAWSIRKEKWYDRTLVFASSSLDERAFARQTSPLPQIVAAVMVIAAGAAAVTVRIVRKRAETARTKAK